MSDYCHLNVSCFLTLFILQFFYPTKYVTNRFSVFHFAEKIVFGITCRVHCRVLNEIIGSLSQAIYMEVNTTISSLIICFLLRISNTTNPLANQQNNYLGII